MAVNASAHWQRCGGAERERARSHDHDHHEYTEMFVSVLTRISRNGPSTRRFGYQGMLCDVLVVLNSTLIVYYVCRDVI